MKKLAFPMVLALVVAISGCGSTTLAPTTNNTESPDGNWGARLTGGADQASLLNFVTSFRLYNSGTLDITGFGFINQGACFALGTIDNPGSSESGSATLTTSTQTDEVTGTFSFTVKSIKPPGNTLILNGNLTGTSSATPQTTGILSNGVVVGKWSLTGGAGDASCNGGGSFIMCQGTDTCTPAT
jgi:hypothetical protein